MTVIFSAHLSMLFGELPLPQRPAAAAHAGFHTVESWWPPDDTAADWASETRRHGLEVACINSYGGNLEAGERGFLNLAARYDTNLADFEAAVRLASNIGAERINVLIGRAAAGVRRKTQFDVIISTLTDIACTAQPAGIRVLIEPINQIDVPGYLVPDAATAAELIEQVGSTNVRLLYDAYHAARTGNDPFSEVERFRDLIEHVQYADCPGRGAPGTGSLDFWRFVVNLEATGYGGALGLEFDPQGPTEEALNILGGARDSASQI